MYTSNDHSPATRARIILQVAWELTSGANAYRYAVIGWLERVTERWGYALAQAAYWRRWTQGE